MTETGVWYIRYYCGILNRRINNEFTFNQKRIIFGKYKIEALQTAFRVDMFIDNFYYFKDFPTLEEALKEMQSQFNYPTADLELIFEGKELDLGNKFGGINKLIDSITVPEITLLK